MVRPPSPHLRSSCDTTITANPIPQNFQASIYIRVKRLKTTTFLHVQPSDTVSSVKSKLQDILQTDPLSQRLYKDDTLLEDSKRLSDFKIESDDVLVLAIKKGDGSWEEKTVVQHDDESPDDE